MTIDGITDIFFFISSASECKVSVKFFLEIQNNESEFNNGLIESIFQIKTINTKAPT